MNVYDNTGRLPIHCCISRKRNEWEQTARFLRDAAFRSQELRGFHGDEFEVDSRGGYNKTPLIEAAEEGDLDRVKDCVRRGASLAAQDEFGETALHYAAENGHYDVVKELVRAGADTKILDDSERTPLACCTDRKRRQWQEVARFLREPWSLKDDTEFSAGDGVRAETGSAASGFFWIDAICINQSDLDERSRQVRIMPDIYSRAMGVIVWLGHDREVDSQITQRYGDVKNIMHRVNKKVKKLKKLERRWLVSLRAFVVDELQDWEMPEGGILTIADIKLILGCFLRSWFSRAWVIQELSLARKIRMFVGDEEFEWHDVLRFLCLLAHVGFFRSSSLWKMDAGWRMEDGKGGDGSEAWRLAEIRLRTANDSDEWAIVDPILQQKRCKAPCVRRAERLSLPLLIAASWSFESKDPRDKIYAILSLAAPLPPDKQILIDYTSPVEDLYTQVGYIFLQGSGRDSMYERGEGFAGILEPLEGLSYVQDPYFSGQQGKMPELPTWVPDFSNPLVTDRIWRRAFSAAKTLEPRFGPGESKGTLQALGLELDIVEVVESGWANLEADDMPPDLEVDVESWFSILEHLPPYNDESPVQMLFRTLCVDQLWRDCDEEARKRNIASFRDFMAWEMARIIKHDNEDEEESDSSSDSSDNSSSEEDLSEFSPDEGESGTSTPVASASTLQREIQHNRSHSSLARLLSSKTSGSRQSLLSRPVAERGLSRLRSWLGRDEEGSGGGARKDEARDANDDDDDARINESKSQPDEKLSATPRLFKPPFSDTLARQRSLDALYSLTGTRFLPSDDEIPAQAQLSDDWCKFHGPSCEALDDEASFRFQMVRTYRKRCLFRTRGGRLGLGPQSVKPGDVVSLIAGSRTPYLLRRQRQQGKDQVEDERGHSLRFLGEAYVHGIMYGEAAVGKKLANLTTVCLS